MARAFREVHRVLRPGGRVSFVEPINRYFGTARPPHLFPNTYDGYDVTPVRALAERVYPAAPRARRRPTRCWTSTSGTC